MTPPLTHQETLVVSLATFLLLTILYAVFVAPRVAGSGEEREDGLYE